MANSKPSNPEKYDTWIDDDGELHVFNGTDWEPYSSPPRAPEGGDPGPAWLIRDFR